MGRGLAPAGKGLLELVEVAGVRVSSAQRAFAGAAAPPAQLRKPETGERGWECKAAGGCLPQSDLGGSCLRASGNPIHSEELEPAAALPLAKCRSVKYSCRATCES